MTIIELIKQIKPIPKLFIRKHSIFSLEVFIDGWYYRDDKEDVRASVLYTEFYEWLQEKYKESKDLFSFIYHREKSFLSL